MRRVIKTKMLEYLRELADRDYQLRVWTASTPGVMSAFTEARCGLYDDSGLTAALDKGEIVFSKEIDSRLREFSEALDSFDEFPVAQSIDSPEMNRVRRWAAEILALLEAEK